MKFKHRLSMLALEEAEPEHPEDFESGWITGFYAARKLAANLASQIAPDEDYLTESLNDLGEDDIDQEDEY